MQPHKLPTHPPVEQPFRVKGLKLQSHESSLQAKTKLASVAYHGSRIVEVFSLSVPTANSLKVSTIMANNYLISAIFATSKMLLSSNETQSLRIAISAKREKCKLLVGMFLGERWSPTSMLACSYHQAVEKCLESEP
ncbi:hypothetical protein M758_5G015800 [Ceratodon purpureus]|nr:hypothetical protein M758_5G015800 [Ceratodon purpureus]